MLEVKFRDAEYYDAYDNQLFFDCDVKVFVNDTVEDCNCEGAVRITDYEIESITDFKSYDINGDECVPDDVEKFIKDILDSWFGFNRFYQNYECEYILGGII